MNGRQLKKLAAVAKMVGGSKNDMEPLQHLYARNDGTFFVTDLDSAFLTIHPDTLPAFNVEGKTLPSVYLPSLKSFANKVSVNAELSFTVDGDTISIEKGSVTKRWKGKFDSEKMPINLLCDFDLGEIVFADDSTTVIDALTRLDKVAATDDYREALNGIYLATDNGEWVATDGHKLGTIPTVGVYTGNVREDGPAFILPQETRKILSKIKPIGNIEIYYGPTHRVSGNICNYAYIRCLDEEGWEYELAVRMPNGPYPPYKKVYPNPAEYRAKFILPLKMMENANKFMIGNINTPAILYLDNDHPRITQVKNGTKTSIDVETEITALTDNKSNTLDGIERIGLNPSLLGDVSKLFNNNPTVYYTDPTTALVLVDETEGTTGLLMPVKLPGE